jgi:hypothetical protein
MAADLSPARPGSCERLGDPVLGELHVTGAGGDRPQARIPARLKELDEPFLVAAHNPLTRLTAETLTRISHRRMSSAASGTQRNSAICTCPIGQAAQRSNRIENLTERLDSLDFEAPVFVDDEVAWPERPAAGDLPDQPVAEA